MTDKSTDSLVEFSAGEKQLKIEGSEEFVSEELSKILDQVDMTASTTPGKNSKSDSSETMISHEQSVSPERPETEQSKTTEEESTNTDLSMVADRLNVESSALEKHFVVDGDNIHVQHPMDIEPKYALLGYCSIKEILTDEQYHENNELKKKLIDVEKVDITEWGRKFLPQLRKKGSIKDNPNTNKKRNKPFKITPSGRKDLIDWINENN